MTTGHRPFGRKLALISAFAVLLVAAFGVGCNGFFTGNTLNTIAITPSSPSFEVGSTLTLQLWGTYQDGSRARVTSGVTWSCSQGCGEINIDPNSGTLSTPANSSGGTAGISASAQGLTATATAAAFLGNVTNFTVCEGTFNTGTCPITNWPVSGIKGGGPQDFYVIGTANGTVLDLTTTSSWSLSSDDGGAISCSNNTTPATCTVTGSSSTGTGPFTVTITYGTPVTNSTSFTITIS